MRIPSPIFLAALLLTAAAAAPPARAAAPSADVCKVEGRVNEPARILADWLSGTTLDYQGANQGVNQLIAGVPRDAGNAQPPGFAAILDETRDHRVARRHVPKDFPTPALVILLPDSIELEGEVRTVERDANAFQLLAAEVVSARPDSALAVQEGHYRRRATIKSAKQLHRNENVAARTRNGICLWICRSIKLVRLDAEFGGPVLWNGILFTYALRDTQP